MRFLLLVLLLFSCAKTEQVNQKKEAKPLSILFSHNISGETHPCGCRQFPFGGLPQVAGQISEIKKDKKVIYIDTGDTFFPTTQIPDSLKKSLTFTAEKLIEALIELKLDYYVPGDQDFALGIDFLASLSHRAPFQFLISNLKNPSAIKHKKWDMIENGEQKIFMIGVIHPETLPAQYAEIFNQPLFGIEESLREISDAGYDEKNINHRLILLSHSGMENDKEFLLKAPPFDFVIGAHSQSFTTYVPNVNKTRLVQVLSKNHYLGEIAIANGKNSENDGITLHEIRDELKNKIEINPFIPFLADYKKKLQVIERDEQLSMSKNIATSETKYPSPVSCIECHKPQVNFWKKTPHSIAYLALVQKEESNRPECVTCHSLGMNDAKGFLTTDQIFTLKEKDRENYLKRVHEIANKATPSIRKLPKEKINEIANEWVALDKKVGVTNNFANVQCQNCHSIESGHPFTVSSSTQTKEERMDRCLSCHTLDQNPEWYKKDGKTVSREVLEKNYKKMSCPKKG